MNSTVPIDVDAERVLAVVPARPLETPSTPQRSLRLAPPVPRARARVARSPLVGGLIAAAIVLLILATQLGLSIAISQGAYEERALEVEQRDLSRVQRLLEQNVETLSSPQNLAENAAALGMVQNNQPATLRLSDGAILGTLDSTTTVASGNLIPNATLENLPVVDAAGLLVSRSAALGTTAGEESSEAPVRWEGQLPAPDTH